jgi:hypothetical protein
LVIDVSAINFKIIETIGGWIDQATSKGGTQPLSTVGNESSVFNDLNFTVIFVVLAC